MGLRASEAHPSWYSNFLTLLRSYAPWLFGGAVMGAGSGALASHVTGTPWGPSVVVGTAAGLTFGGLSRDVYPRMYREIFGKRIPLNARPLVEARRIIARDSGAENSQVTYLKEIDQKLKKAEDAGNADDIAQLCAEYERVLKMNALTWWQTEGLKRERNGNESE